MTSYIEFIKWWLGGVSLSHPVVRIALYLITITLGSMAFGPGEHWLILFSLIVAIDLLAMMIAWKYEEFQKQNDNR
jgi:hypothetical protein